MRIQITQSNLHKALNLLSRVASNRTPLPILSNVLLTASKGTLTLAATNLEVAITHTTSGKIDEEGSTTIPARLLHDFVSQLPKQETVDLLFEKTKLFISSGAYSSTIQGAAAEDFPALPSIKSTSKVDIDTETLKNALNRTMFAASSDETRPILGGVYFHSVDGKLVIAATDGYRLAETELADIDTQISCVVPLSSLQDVQRIIQETDNDSIRLQFEDSQFGALAGDTQLVSRLIDGQYPEYRQLIPEKSEITFQVARNELLTATKLAGLFARESGGSINVRASETDKAVSISSVASQVGENNSKLPATVKGTGEVVLNVRYLTDALNAFEGQTVDFRFSGAISPCVLTAKDQPGYQHIVMPLKS
jgi:DNA polymerase III subunit beta